MKKKFRCRRQNVWQCVHLVHIMHKPNVTEST